MAIINQPPNNGLPTCKPNRCLVPDAWCCLVPPPFVPRPFTKSCLHTLSSTPPIICAEVVVGCLLKASAVYCAYGSAQNLSPKGSRLNLLPWPVGHFVNLICFYYYYVFFFPRQDSATQCPRWTDGQFACNQPQRLVGCFALRGCGIVGPECTRACVRVRVRVQCSACACACVCVPSMFTVMVCDHVCICVYARARVHTCTCAASIAVNGEKLDGHTWSKQVRYSPSTNDHLTGVLTVKEHIMLSSRLAHGSDPNWDHEASQSHIITQNGL